MHRVHKKRFPELMKFAANIFRSLCHDAGRAPECDTNGTTRLGAACSSLSQLPQSAQSSVKAAPNAESAGNSAAEHSNSSVHSTPHSSVTQQRSDDVWEAASQDHLHLCMILLTASAWIPTIPEGKRLNQSLRQLKTDSKLAVQRLLQLLLRCYLPRMDLDVSKLYMMGWPIMLHLADATLLRMWLDRFAADFTLHDLRVISAEQKLEGALIDLLQTLGKNPC